MNITNDFPGANIRVLSVNENDVHLAVDMRDSVDEWFYWCFKVEGAGGQTITFHLNPPCVGYYGAAVSHDYKTWNWQYFDKGHEGGSFTYTFDEEENEVWFAHDMLYRPERFYEFARENSLEIKTLCTTKKGRGVPYLDIGDSSEIIFLTARHHACESTGSYVLEGVLRQFLRDAYWRKYRIICVPFVDFDGVLDGDQGKNRNPYDHNRDYDRALPAIYETTREIRSMAEKMNVVFAFDFHSPWHLGGENDTAFIPVASKNSIEKTAIFSKLWEAENTADTVPHFEVDDRKPDVGWNRSDNPTAALFFDVCGAEISITVETPYFCAGDISFSPERAINQGKCMVQALKKYDIGGRV